MDNKPDNTDKEKLVLPTDSFDSLVKEISDFLTEGPMEDGDQDKKVKKNLSPKYEFRIQTSSDPIAEETKHFRDLAEEVDDRYDAYMKRVEDSEKKEE